MNDPVRDTCLGPIEWHCLPFDRLAPRELQAIHVARQQVFVIEQACLFQDADEADAASLHLWASERGELLAYARIVAPGIKYADASIGRVLTTRRARGAGLGRALLDRAIAQCRAAHPGCAIVISAQLRLERFYADAGFMREGGDYLEDGQPHLQMRRPAEAASAVRTAS